MKLRVSSQVEVKEYSERFKLLYITVAIAAALLFLRLWHLQINQGSELRIYSEENRIKETKIPAPRGIVYDRNNEILIDNIPGYEAVITPQYTIDLESVSQKVGSIVNIDPLEIKQIVTKSRRQSGPFFPARIKDNLSRKEIFYLKRAQLQFPGLDVREAILRHYPLEENGAQLFGYVSEISKKQLPLFNQKFAGQIKFRQGDIIGKSGLEEVFDIQIRGTDGVSYIQIDARGREASTEGSIYSQVFRDQEAIPGNNVTLTIDKDIQKIAFESFNAYDRNGALVALKSNGEVLAWISSPSFDPNEFSKGISSQLWTKLINDPFKPLRNKVIQDHHSPGSTFKPFVAIAALEEKIISPSTIIFCPGIFRFGRRAYHDHLRSGFGNVTVLDALERSSNVFFYKMGNSLGIDHMHRYISALGIGSKTGIELAQTEAPGLMPSSEWKKNNVGEVWQLGENLSTAIGQGFVLTTPLQMAMAYLTIANEGKLYQPFVVKKIISPDGEILRESNPTLLHDLSKENKDNPELPVISDETFKTVKKGMWRVTNGERGTAKWWKIPGVEFAGKTGTSQVMSFSSDALFQKCNEKPMHQRHHGWFVGYAPADNPEIIVAAFAEHACAGSTGAAPIVRDVIWSYFDKYHPEKLKSPFKRLYPVK